MDKICYICLEEIKKNCLFFRVIIGFGLVRLDKFSVRNYLLERFLWIKNHHWKSTTCLSSSLDTPNDSILTSIIVIKVSESRSGPTDAESTVKLNLEAKSSLERVSTCIEVNVHALVKNLLFICLDDKD